MKTRQGAALAACAAALTLLGTARADDVVQLPLTGVLDGRPVSTLTNGVEVPWTTGIDASDAFVTSALAAHLGQSGPGLPDDGTFPQNADHPLVALHFSNDAPATTPQAHLLTGVGTIDLPVPAATYSKVFLLLTSSKGDSMLNLTLSYQDGTISVSAVTLPDWGTGNPLPTDPPIFFSLVASLHKWNAQDMSVDTPTHGITGLVLTPSPTKTLSNIRIAKTSATPYLTLWGATGVATSPVAGLLDGGPASDGPASDGPASDGPVVSIGHDAGGAAETSGEDARSMDAPPSDAGPAMLSDAGGGVDTGSAGPFDDATEKTGCGCAVEARAMNGLGALLALGIALAARRRR